MKRHRALLPVSGAPSSMLLQDFVRTSFQEGQNQIQPWPWPRTPSKNDRFLWFLVQPQKQTKAVYLLAPTCLSCLILQVHLMEWNHPALLGWVI